MDQPDRLRNVTTHRGPSPALMALDRQLRAILADEEAAGIGSAVAGWRSIVRGDWWKEAKASAVLVAAIVRWLGPDAVRPLAFYAKGSGPVEVVAQVGDNYITGHGIHNERDLMANCCHRHRAGADQSGLQDFDLTKPISRFTMGSSLAQRAADRLTVLLTEEIDPEIARIVLGA